MLEHTHGPTGAPLAEGLLDLRENADPLWAGHLRPAGRAIDSAGKNADLLGGRIGRGGGSRSQLTYRGCRPPLRKTPSPRLLAASLGLPVLRQVPGRFERLDGPPLPAAGLEEERCQSQARARQKRPVPGERRRGPAYQP